MPETAPREIPLADASRALGWPYGRAYDALLKGVLEGRRDALGRWVVAQESIDRLKRTGGKP